MPRLAARAPSARALFVARLDGYALRFHKRGRDGSGKADAFATGRPGDAVWGVVCALDEADKRALDRSEGVPNHYRSIPVSVCPRDGGEPLAAITYVAAAARIAPELKPYAWYHALVLAGARAHGLPADYIRRLELVEVAQDPDRARHARFMKFANAAAPLAGVCGAERR